VGATLDGMSLPVVFALLAVSAVVFYGGNALRRRKGGHVGVVDAHPRLAAALALLALAALFAIVAASVWAVVSSSTTT